jgi:hypothetical protein
MVEVMAHVMWTPPFYFPFGLKDDVCLLFFFFFFFVFPPLPLPLQSFSTHTATTITTTQTNHPYHTKEQQLIQQQQQLIRTISTLTERWSTDWSRATLGASIILQQEQQLPLQQPFHATIFILSSLLPKQYLPHESSSPPPSSTHTTMLVPLLPPVDWCIYHHAISGYCLLLQTRVSDNILG